MSEDVEPATIENRAVAESVNMLHEQIDELRTILVGGKSDFQLAKERLLRWKERTTKLIASKVNQSEAAKFANKRKGSFIMGQPYRNLADEAKMYRAFLDSLADEIITHPDEILSAAQPVENPSEVEIKIVDPPSSPSTLPEIFIVHGHDELNLLRLKELLRERWKLDSIVLKGAPGKGRTLIEKFEDEAQRAAFAFVLLTPDDNVQTTSGEYAQARPNVIFELGWFYGRLSRSRVCILYKEGTKLHSDLDGISRIEFSKDVAEKIAEIERELVSAEMLKK
jgi:predicted nucleotide-binding protein